MGVYLSIVSGAIKLCNYIAAALQQHHDEMNGVTAQKEATDAANIKTLEAVGAPISKSESDKLWADNAKRFGTDGKPSG